MRRSLPTGQQVIASLKSGPQVMRNLRTSTSFDESVLPKPLEDWLSKLALLYGVPFEHLVANSAMLPKESLRFFFVDPNWISCLLDGALSVGTQSSRDETLMQTVYPEIQKSVQGGMQLVRRRLAGAPMPAEVNTSAVVAGMLMRSQLVSGWPGLEIVPYEDYTIDQYGVVVPGAKIDVLRMERLSPDVMLCLFAKVPKLVQLSEPKEGLSFGTLSDGKVAARFIGHTSTQPVGVFIRDNDQLQEADVVKRAGGKNVIDMLATRDGLKTILQKFNAMDNPGQLNPADMAIQLIKAAEQQSFVNGPVTQPNAKDCTDY